MEILSILYLIVGYWAVNQTIYRNKIVIEYKVGSVFAKKLAIAAVFGWILIPVAIIFKIIKR